MASASLKFSSIVALDFGAREILFDLRHVEAGFLGRGHRARLVGLTAAAEQLLVEVEIFLAGRILHAHGDRDLGGLDRAWLSTGNSFSTTFSLGSVFIRSSMSVIARLQ